MKESTRNKKLKELLGEGYIIYIPGKESYEYTLLGNSSNQKIWSKIKTAIEFEPETNNEYKAILSNMLTFDFGFPAYEEREALNYAIKNL